MKLRYTVTLQCNLATEPSDEPRDSTHIVDATPTQMRRHVHLRAHRASAKHA